MYKLLRFAIRFLIVWYFTIIFYNWLNLPVNQWLNWTSNNLMIIGQWINNASQGAHLTINLGITAIIIIIIGRVSAEPKKPEKVKIYYYTYPLKNGYTALPIRKNDNYRKQLENEWYN